VHESVDHSLGAPVASPDDVLTAEEVASLLRMTPAWVYSETRQDRIPHMRFGRRFRYRRSAIDAWMRALESGRLPEYRAERTPVAASTGGRRAGSRQGSARHDSAAQSRLF
jgi:excisionase family DNA binding protein